MLIWRAWLRDGIAHPWQNGLSLLGIALGVAVVIAIKIANDSAAASFDRAQQASAGRASHRIDGGPAGLPETLHGDLRRLGLPGVTTTPLLQGRVRLVGEGGSPARLLGIDPMSELAFRDYPATGKTLPWARLMTEPGTVFLGDALANRLGIGPGAEIAVDAGSGAQPLRVIGIWSDTALTVAAGDLVVADLSTAQETLDRVGVLSAIDVAAGDTADEGALERLRRALPDGLRLEPSTASGNVRREMTRAFRTNLTALSLLALVIGGFLIYNSMSFTVLRRRAQIGMLRAVGVTRSQMLATVLAEALVHGMLASMAGWALGHWLARGLLARIAGTIEDLYFTVEALAPASGPGQLAAALALGLGVTLLAAAVPAIDAARAPPRASLARGEFEQRVHRLSRVSALAGVACMLLSGALLWLLPGRSLVVGFGGLFLLLIGYALVVPALIGQLGRLPWPGLTARLAGRGIARSLSRTGVAVAALAVALAATVGVGVMITGFRYSVEQWLDSQLRADVYVALPRDHARGLAAAYIDRLRMMDGVNAVTTSRRIRLGGADGTIELFAVDPLPAAFAGFQLLEGDPDLAWEAFTAGRGVLVSEPYAYRYGVGAGHDLRLETPAGPRVFGVAGIYRDYGSHLGVVAMNRSVYRRDWGDPRVTSAALYLDPGADPARVRDALAMDASAPAELSINATRDLRLATLAIFDRTFTVTHVLRTLAIIVAAMGIFAALVCLHLERAREYAVMRAIGFGPRRLAGLLGVESLIMGAAAGLLALPLGVALAALLISVINRRAFGWSMMMVVEPVLLAQALLLGLLAAGAAALYPAWRAVREPPGLALRGE